MCVCLVAAYDAIREGATADRVADAVTALAPRIENAFLAPDASGGRVPRTDGIHVFGFTDGQSRTLAEVRDLADAPAVIARAVARVGRVYAAVGFAARDVEHHADELATGPSSFGAFWWPADLPR